MNFPAAIKLPSAFLPLAMSAATLAVVLGHVAIFSVAREADEGAAAHLWQLLMAGQVPLIAYFAIKWLPRAPRSALGARPSNRFWAGRQRWQNEVGHWEWWLKMEMR